VALPYALRDIERQMAGVSEQLQAGRADAPVTTAMLNIEADIAALLETMKEEAKAAQANAKQGKPCKACDNRNKLLAELKVLRMLQVRINDQTVAAEGRREDAGVLGHELQQLVRAVRDRQEQVHRATSQLHERACAECAEGGH
jgi:hypothetical protein